MKKKQSIIGRLLNGCILDSANYQTILCDLVFGLFPSVPEINGELYETTISKNESEGARKIYFKVSGIHLGLIDWSLTEDGGFSCLFDAFEEFVRETLPKKEIKKDAVFARWISFKLIK